MKWIEFIRVRSSAATLHAAMPDLRAQAAQLEASVPALETFFLQHALYDGDLALVMIWRTSADAQETREGLLFAERLRRLGSVEHAVWQPTTDQQSLRPVAASAQETMR